VEVLETRIVPSVQLIQPDPSVGATFVGNAGVSTDGLGTRGTGTLQAEVPSGSTVEFAYLHVVTRTTNAPAFQPPSISFEGQAISLTYRPNVDDVASFNFETGRADVTSIVRNKIGSSGGIFNFTVDETSTASPDNVEGTSLTVIFSNPALPVRSIAVLDGGLTGPTAQTTTLSLVDPIDKSNPDFVAQMALGIQFGFQLGNPLQFSTIDVNGTRLTSSAGNFNDGIGENGALITVGGVGDSTTNPSDPLANNDTSDDELYNLTPLVTDGATQVRLDTANPSNDDSIFLVVLMLSGRANVSGNLDFGDAPDPTYPTLEASNGARHAIEPGY